MTDITELAQREKFEAWWERTQHNGNPPRFGWSHWRDGEGYKVDDDESELDGMWEAWKAAGDELVEALEKAQQTEKTLKSRNCRLEWIITAAENRISELGKTIAEQDKRLINYAEISTRNAERAAELESRTVKLPDLRQIVSGDRYVWSDGVYNYSQDVKVALAAAGIKVETE